MFFVIKITYEAIFFGLLQETFGTYSEFSFSVYNAHLILVNSYFRSWKHHGRPSYKTIVTTAKCFITYNDNI